MYNIFAIADIHLPAFYSARRFNLPPGYWQKVQTHLWQNNPEVVLIAGDLAWGTNLTAIKEEMDAILALPGKYKIFVEGNHDPWFDALGDTYAEAQRQAYELFSDEGLYYIGGRAITVKLEDGSEIGICGAKGFARNPEDRPSSDDQIQKMYQLESMQRALTQMKGLMETHKTLTNICLMHYGCTARIFTDGRKGDEDFYNLIVNSQVIQKVVFGHIHVDNHLRVFTENKHMQLYCAAVDRIGFQAMRIMIP